MTSQRLPSTQQHNLRSSEGLIQTKHLPPPPLDAYIEHVWTLRADTDSYTSQEILVPNGRPGVVFCLGQQGTRIDTATGEAYRHGSLYYSVATRPFVIKQQGLARYVGVELKPYGLTAFASSARTPNSVRPLDALFNKEGVDRLLEDLRAQPDLEATAKRLLTFLAEHITPLGPTDMQRLAMSTAMIKSKKGDIRTLEVAEQLHLSPSTLRRLFHRYIGVSPEQFIAIVRYASFVETLILSSHNPSLVATLHGYYDEAHAAKDFKKYTGLNKRAFLNVCDNLTRIMHAL